MTGRRSTATAVGALLALAVSAFTYVTTETLPIGLLLLMTADLGVSPSACWSPTTGWSSWSPPCRSPT